MSELSAEARRVIAIGMEIDRLSWECSALDAERSDTRDWDQADELERRQESLRRQENDLVNALKAEDITIEYDDRKTTVFKHGRLWLEFGVWHEYPMEGQE